MMAKVKVNKVVAGWIEEEKKCCGDDTFWLLYEVLGKRTNSEYENIDIVTLAKAIQYGYEVPYEFKVGDIVEGNISKRIYEITEIVSPNYVRCVVKGSTYGFNPGQFTLICKAENREDLRHDQR